MSGLVATVVAAGYPVAALVVMLESLGAPLPGETLIIALGAAAGTNTGTGGSSLLPLFLALWAGSVIGDNIGYFLGRRYGAAAVWRLGRHVGLTEPRLARLEEQYRRFGAAVVMVARFFIILRQLNGILAGSFGLAWWRFLAANAIGAALWVGFWLYFSARLSAEALSIIGHLHGFKLVGLALAAVAALAGLALWRLRRRRART
ncbi:MAG: DedA family protein [Hyphomicrobiales bacterium]